MSLAGEMLEEIIAAIPNGLYVTDLIGHGVNIVTGDYSTGASGSGLKTESSRIRWEEITVAAGS